MAQTSIARCRWRPLGGFIQGRSASRDKDQRVNRQLRGYLREVAHLMLVSIKTLSSENNEAAAKVNGVRYDLAVSDAEDLLPTLGVLGQ